MPRLQSLLLTFGLLTALAGCQLQGPGLEGTEGDVTPNAVAGGEIEVTALDAAAEGGAELAPGGEAIAKPQTAPPEPAAEPAPEAPDPAPQPDLGEAAPDAEAEAAAEPEPEPEPEKPEQQIACEKKKGQWVSTAGQAFTCIFMTKDADKTCTRGTQCEGDCLARTGTCAPIRPLLGCNEILQDDGKRATLCIE